MSSLHSPHADSFYLFQSIMRVCGLPAWQASECVCRAVEQSHLDDEIEVVIIIEVSGSAAMHITPKTELGHQICGELAQRWLADRQQEDS